MFYIDELQKKKSLDFEETLAIKEDLLARDPVILDLENVVAKGTIRYEESLFLLTYDLSYDITLASSRSMEPVHLRESYPVSEIFIKSEDLEKQAGGEDEDFLLPIEGDGIELAESVADNILLNIPLKVLTPEEEAGAALPEGKDWQVMTEEDYAKAQAEKKAETSPFAGLANFLQEEE